MTNDNNVHELRGERPKISSTKPTTTSNLMPDPNIPAVIRIHQSPDTTAADDLMDDLGGGLDDNATTMHQDEEVKEQVTVQDLQAMKQMIREIRQNPELLYEYSPAFSHYARRHRTADIIHQSRKQC
mmetsp:Transcript_28208/g.51017  ORF Transcript_28208/g.51017 Transcript_28208/m.51017 type:complete len:127 (+) Transcript_28208:108-488(+)|eukprot:CAMPEP_0201874610 /NCGR_PEP_ID=MMETSP0902-20130614/6823_1 /ASSEMBLY_ACC=CAM_ASM_000551 /TAXON_ID=420261 /ORGANISM="Thalassiosira antarctica, Strain CCMP982" /LENGTH=126 /DNA_ID=CAMNT_0048401521 /DNA_START=45 /DNA_END=425 /DNA_ORIENTATION=-